jgi:uncharacterized membrane protein (DUF485 family)
MSVDNAYMLDRKRRVRRTTWLLAAVALGFYVTFIILSVRSAHG